MGVNVPMPELRFLSPILSGEDLPEANQFFGRALISGRVQRLDDLDMLQEAGLVSSTRLLLNYFDCLLNSSFNFDFDLNLPVMIFGATVAA